MALARDGMYYQLAIPCNLASEGFVSAKCILRSGAIQKHAKYL